ncbi:alpha/beta hydrolase [Nocardia sp. NPDC052566]|uniref:alpha/beta hydrolase n=1 Tax=Nocardia sp. NPDC052566 TaxID=3364330 RepID=UPI0037C7CBEB
MPLHRISRTAVVVGAVAMSLAAGTPMSSGDTGASIAAHGPRVRAELLADVPATVLLPTGYDSSAERRYPVLYLLHPYRGTETSWLDDAHVAELAGTEDTIVVMPRMPTSGLVVDSANGRCRDESRMIDGLVPAVDAKYRTVADRRDRAVAGVNSSGISAMYLAARHPEVLGIAGAMSAPLDLSLGLGTAGRVGATAFLAAIAGECGNPLGQGLFGAPTDETAWARRNPADLAAQLGDSAVYVSAGNGIPCQIGDLVAPLPVEPGEALVDVASRIFPSEPFPAYSAQSFAQALNRAQVRHTADFGGCGQHTWLDYRRQLAKFLPWMSAAFGKATS